MKSFQKWFRLLAIRGKPINIFLSIFFVSFSGIGYLFVNQFNDVNYFNKNISFGQKVKVFYGGDFGKYLVSIGKETEAEKHNIVINKNNVKKYIYNMQQFQKDGAFDKEVYAQFLKDNKITQYDVWQYATQQSKIDIFFNMFSNFPKKTFEVLDNIISTEKNIDSISGIQYLINDNIINEIVAKQMEFVTHEDLKNFIQYNTKDSGYLFIKPEKRKGFVIEIPDKKLSDLNKENLNLIIRSHLNANNARAQMSKLFKFDVNIIEFNDFVDRGTGIKDLLFEEVNFYQIGHSIFIPIVTDIQPIAARDFTPEQLSKIKDDYERMLFKKESILYAFQLSNMLNKGLISEDFLNKHCFKKNFVKTLAGANTSELKFFTTDINKSIAFMNYEGKGAVFICKKRNFKKSEQSMFSMLKQMGYDVSSQIMDSFSESLLVYWIKNFENK